MLSLRCDKFLNWHLSILLNKSKKTKQKLFLSPHSAELLILLCLNQPFICKLSVCFINFPICDTLTHRIVWISIKHTKQFTTSTTKFIITTTTAITISVVTTTLAGSVLFVCRIQAILNLSIYNIDVTLFHLHFK